MNNSLTITLRKNKGMEEIATIYLNNSAFTKDALQSVNKFLQEYIKNEKNIKDERLRAIKTVEKFKGGIWNICGEVNYVQELYPNENFRALIGGDWTIVISQKLIDRIQYNSQCEIYIDLDEKEVLNNTVGIYDSIEQYQALANSKESDFEEIDFDIFKINFDKLETILNSVMKTNKTLLKLKNKEVFYELKSN